MPLYNPTPLFALDRRQTFKIVTSFGDMKHYSILLSIHSKSKTSRSISYFLIQFGNRDLMITYTRCKNSDIVKKELNFLCETYY